MSQTGTPSVPPPSGEWARLRLWQIQFVRDILILFAIGALLWLGYYLSVVTVPLLLAVALAYLFEPVVRKMTFSWGFSRRISAVFIIAVVWVAVVLPMSFAVGYGVLQAAGYIERVSDNVSILLQSVENPADKDLERRLPNDGWRRLRDRLVRVREDAKRARQLNPAPDGSPPAGKDGPAPGKAPAEGSASSGAPPVGAAPAPAGGAGTGAPPANAPADAAKGPEPPAPPPIRIVDPARAAATELDPLAVALYNSLDWLSRWIKANAEAIGRQALRTSAGAVEVAFGILGSVGLLVFTLLLTTFFFYFVCVRYFDVQHSLLALIPESRQDRTLELVGMMDRVIAGFVRGRLTICAILAVYYVIAYWFIGVGSPILLGIIVGTLALVPYATTMVIPVIVLMMWLNPGLQEWQTQWWWIVFAPIGVAIFAQVIDDYVLTPAIQGKHTGLDAPAIVFASLSGALLGGLFGLLIAIPTAACLKILLREVLAPRFRQWAKGRTSDPLPIAPVSAPPPATNPPDATSAS